MEALLLRTSVLQEFANLFSNFGEIKWQMVLMWAVGGVMFAKFLNLFLPKDKKINPMIGAAGISAFLMSGRVINQMGLKEDNQNFLLMQSISVNVSGQIASVIAGGLILTLVS